MAHIHVDWFYSSPLVFFSSFLLALTKQFAHALLLLFFIFRFPSSFSVFRSYSLTIFVIFCSTVFVMYLSISFTVCLLTSAFPLLIFHSLYTFSNQFALQWTVIESFALLTTQFFKPQTQSNPVTSLVGAQSTFQAAH